MKKVKKNDDKKNENEKNVSTTAPWIDFKNEIVIIQEEKIKEKEEVESEDEYDLSTLLKKSSSPQNTKKLPPPRKSLLLQQKQEQKENILYYPRLCKFGSNCKQKSKCDRAHTFDQWDPKICKYQHKCNIAECFYYHSHYEDKNIYLQKILQFKDTNFTKFYVDNKYFYVKNFNL